MESALYITHTNELSYYESKYSRLYFGNEFCQRLIPSLREVKQILEFVSEKKLNLTLVTPYVTNHGLDKLKEILRKVEDEKPNSEVVFNDWGTLKLLNEEFSSLAPVMGRLLNKMKRGPRLLNLVDELPENTVNYFRSCSLDTSFYQNFLKDYNVMRAEVDNPLQGIDIDLNTEIDASLYKPYAYLTTTRLCLAASCNIHGKEDDIGIFSCNKECQDYVFNLNHSIMPVTLIRKGNTMFFKNDELPENLEENNIDRIVVEPEVPL